MLQVPHWHLSGLVWRVLHGHLRGLKLILPVA
jgi:hypothetical protein